MAAMNTLTRISHIALATALLLPASAMAQEMSPDQSAWYRAQMGLSAMNAAPPSSANDVGEALMEWRRLTQNTNASFDQLSRFLITNPDWPEASAMRNRAEKAIALDSYDPARVIAFFNLYPPRTPSGELRYALALYANGQRDQAATAARRAWTSGALDDMETSRALTYFGNVISKDDHDARMDRLLWSNATAAASRQLSLTSSERRAVFSARLAMRSKAVDAQYQASSIEANYPAITREDAGYITDKATWLRTTGRVGEARALLAGPRQLRAPPLDAEEWLKTLLTNARQADSGGDKITAYNIARQLDDALPAGTVVRETELRVRDDYTSLAWLAGQLAFETLGRPAEAAQLYHKYGEAARSAQTRTKGYYWAGRAALASGNNTNANAHFNDAAQFYDQFYGQLSLERLGRSQPRPATEPSVSISSSDRRDFEQSRLVRAAKALGEMGSWREQSLFLRAIADKVKSPAEHAMAGQLSQAIGRPDLGVMVGRSAQSNSMDAVEVSGFPIVRVPAGHESNWTFIHAITRQESQFDRAAVSRASARGMMQLMPATAREVSGKLGIGYNESALTTDTNYNLTLGSSYFQQMMSYFGGSYPLAVAAYNAGPGNVNRWLRSNGDPRNASTDVLRWIEAIPFSETRNYVHRVLENAVVYDSLRPDGARANAQAPLSTYLGKRTPG